MDAQEIIERIMSGHWDMTACPCWVCEAGRSLGFSPRGDYLPHKHGNRQRYPTITYHEWQESNVNTP